MCVGQVSDMYIVTNGGAIGRGIVGAEHRQGLPPRFRSPNGKGNDVCLRAVLLADFSHRVGAGGIEITQRYPSYSIGSLEVAQHALHDKLTRAIWTGRTLRMIFCYGKR